MLPSFDTSTAIDVPTLPAVLLVSNKSIELFSWHNGHQIRDAILTFTPSLVTCTTFTAGHLNRELYTVSWLNTFRVHLLLPPPFNHLVRTSLLLRQVLRRRHRFLHTQGTHQSLRLLPPNR